MANDRRSASGHESRGEEVTRQAPNVIGHAWEGSCEAGSIELMGGPKVADAWLLEPEARGVLSGRGMGCLFDGCENLGASLGLEFVPVEAEKEALPDHLGGRIRVLFPDRRLEECSRRIPHVAAHLQPLFA